MQKQVLTLRGMTCAACAQRIEKTIRKMPGVTEANVNLASEKLFISFDDTQLTMPAITQAIAKIGYEAVPPADTQTATIPIGGMTCAACSQRIEKTLSSLAGVERASVNLATEQATVVYKPTEVRLSGVRAAIERLGYQARPAQKRGMADEDRARKQREISVMWRKFFFSVLFSLPLLYIAMAR